MKALTYTRYLILAFLSLCAAACSEKTLDEINKDVNHPQDVDAKFIFADLCTATAFNIVGGDYNTYFGVAVEHWGGTHNQLYGADIRQGQWNVSSTFNNSWSSHYSVIKDARITVGKCADDAEGTDAGNAGLRGAAEVLLAYNSALLTDLYGDTPYSEAGDFLNHKTPVLDSQESIYETVNKLLDAAITDLGAASSTELGNYDLIYGGSVASWRRFAYGLRARLAMHTVSRASNAASVYAQIISDCDSSFVSRKGQAAFSAYDGDNQINPLFGFEYSRHAIAVSKSLYEKLEARDDPRRNLIYFGSARGDMNHKLPTSDEFKPVPNGEGEQNQRVYTYDCFLYAIDAPTYLLSYHEVQFLKAEALARLGRDDEAKACVRNAIDAAFEDVNDAISSAVDLWLGSSAYVEGDSYAGVTLSSEDADAYYNATVAPLSGTALLAEIMVQKYLAMYGANGESVETYNDVRRLRAANENFIALANPKNDTQFPLRAGYGSSDTTTNPNVQAAFGNGQYVYTEPVWWAGGTR